MTKSIIIDYSGHDIAALDAYDAILAGAGVMAEVRSDTTRGGPSPWTLLVTAPPAAYMTAMVSEAGKTPGRNCEHSGGGAVRHIPGHAAVHRGGRGHPPASERPAGRLQARTGRPPVGSPIRGKLRLGRPCRQTEALGLTHRSRRWAARTSTDSEPCPGRTPKGRRPRPCAANGRGRQGVAADALTPIVSSGMSYEAITSAEDRTLAVGLERCPPLGGSLGPPGDFICGASGTSGRGPTRWAALTGASNRSAFRITVGSLALPCRGSPV